jgi:hypothetical protein
MAKLGTDFTVNDYLLNALDESGSQFALVDMPQSGDYDETAQEYEELATEIHDSDDDLLVNGREWWTFFGDDNGIIRDTMLDLEGTCRVAFHWDVQLISVPVTNFEGYTTEVFHNKFGQIFDWCGMYQDIAFDFDYRSIPDSVLDQIDDSTIKFGLRVHTEDILDGVIDREFFSRFRDRIYMLDVDVPHVENYYVPTSDRFEETDNKKVFFSEVVDWLFSEDNAYYVNLHSKGVNDFKRKKEIVLDNVQEIDTGWS